MIMTSFSNPVDVLSSMDESTEMKPPLIDTGLDIGFQLNSGLV
jgi:hypothetical protein